MVRKNWALLKQLFAIDVVSCSLNFLENKKHNVNNCSDCIQHLIIDCRFANVLSREGNEGNIAIIRLSLPVTNKIRILPVCPGPLSSFHPETRRLGFCGMGSTSPLYIKTPRRNGFLKILVRTKLKASKVIYIFVRSFNTCRRWFVIFHLISLRKIIKKPVSVCNEQQTNIALQKVVLVMWHFDLKQK